MRNKSIVFLFVILALIFIGNMKSYAVTVPCFSISSNNYSSGDKMTFNGENATIMIIGIILVLSISVIMYRKYKNYKGIK